MKKILKRTIALVLTLALSLSMLCTVGAADAAKVTISATPERTTVLKPGDEIKISIGMPTATNVGAYDIAVRYDGDSFDVVKNAEGDFAYMQSSAPLAQNEKESGLLYVNWVAALGKNLSELFYFNLKVKADAPAGSTGMTLAAGNIDAMADKEENLYDVTFTPTTFYIAGLTADDVAAGQVATGASLDDIAAKLTVMGYTAGEAAPDSPLSYGDNGYSLAFCNAAGEAATQDKTVAGKNYVKITWGEYSKVVSVACAPITNDPAKIDSEGDYGQEKDSRITYTNHSAADIELSLSLSGECYELYVDNTRVPTNKATITVPANGTKEATVAFNRDLTAQVTGVAVKGTLTAAYTDSDDVSLNADTSLSYIVNPASYTYTVAPTSVDITAGSTQTVPSLLTPTNEKNVSGTLQFYSDSSRQTEIASDAAFFQNMAVGTTGSIYWMFTPDGSSKNYKTDTTTGSVSYKILDGEPQYIKMSYGNEVGTSGTGSYGDGLFKLDAAAYSDAGFTTPTNATVTWSSLDTTVADITAEGEVTIKKVGSVALRATVASVAGQYAGAYADYTLTVSPRAVSISGITASNKFYDGTTDAELITTDANFQEKLEGDTLTVSGTGTFADKNASDTAITVTISNLTLGGEDAANYTLATSGNQETTTAKINKQPVIVSGITANEKTYDNTTDATLVTNNAIFTGKVAGETLTVRGTGTFEDKNAGENKTVNLTNLTLGGEDEKNYTLAATGQQATATATIAKKAVTVSNITAADKPYDGMTNATLVTKNASFLDKYTGDVLTVSGTGTFEDSNAGTGKTVTISGLTLGGEDEKNYTLAKNGQQTSATASILKATNSTTLNAPGKTLLSSAVAGSANKSYDYTLTTITGIPTDAGTVTYALKDSQNYNSITDVSITGSTLSFKTGVSAGVANSTESIVIVVSSTNYTNQEVTLTCTYKSKTDVSSKLTMDAISVTYGDSYTPVAKYNNATSDNFTYTYQNSSGVTIEKPTAAGTYKVIATYEDDLTENEIPGHIGTVSATLTINKRAISLKMDNKTITFGDAAPTDFTYQITSGSMVGTEKLTITYQTNYTAGSDAGDYTITPSVTENAVSANYAVTTVGGTLTVSRKDITGAAVTLGDQLTYTGSEQSQTVTGVTLSGWDRTITYALTNNTATNAGTYTLTVTGNGNYTGKATTQYTIAKMTVSPSAALVAGQTPTYTGRQQKPAITITCTPALTKGTDYTISYGANVNAGAGAGSYTVAPVATSNYTFTTLNETFDITKAVLTATYTGETVYVGETPAFTVNVTGFVNGETAATAAGYTAPAVAQATTTAGTYALTPAGGDATNYSFTGIAGDLKVIDKLSLTVSGIDKTLLSTELASELQNEGKYTVSLGQSSRYNTFPVAIQGTAALTTYASSNVQQGSGQWVGFLISNVAANNAAAASITDVQYSSNGNDWYSVTAADVAEANTLNNNAGNAFVWWLKTEDFTNNEMTLYVRIGTGDPVTLNLTYTAYRQTTTGGSTASARTVTVASSKGGAVTISKSNAKKGDTVTLTIRPDNGKVLDTLKVTTASGDTVKTTLNKDGTYSFVMPGERVSITATFTDRASVNPFVDVDKTDWFYDDVMYVYENDLMNGLSADRFYPMAYASRAQIVTVLWRMAGSPTGSRSSGFTDLTQNWYVEAVNWAVEKGITGGVGENRFAPDENVSRETFAAFLFRYAKSMDLDVSGRTSLGGFTDADKISNWASEALSWAVDASIIGGSNNAILPAGLATRAELAAMIARFMKSAK